MKGLDATLLMELKEQIVRHTGIFRCISEFTSVGVVDCHSSFAFVKYPQFADKQLQKSIHRLGGVPFSAFLNVSVLFSYSNVDLMKKKQTDAKINIKI